MPTRRQTKNQFRALRWAQGDRCAGCGRHVPSARKLPRFHPDRPTFDHVVPHCRGGRRTLDNGLLKHLRCNHARGERWPSGCDLIWHDFVMARLAQRPRSFKAQFRKPRIG